MSKVLVNLAMLMSFGLFVLSLGIGFLRGVSLWPLFFRSTIIMMVGMVVILAFFRYFNLILVRFLSQRIREHWEAQRAEKSENEGEGGNR